MRMKRLTERHYKTSDGYYIRCSEHCNKDICDCGCEKHDREAGAEDGCSTPEWRGQKEE